VTAGVLVQTAAVLSGGSYLSQNDLRIHVGLGGASRVDKVEIFWPAGSTEVLTQLTADHVYDVKEGEGIVSQEKIKPVLPKH
jgi:enediyne biosynthesis protein E4